MASSGIFKSQNLCTRVQVYHRPSEAPSNKMPQSQCHRKREPPTASNRNSSPPHYTNPTANSSARKRASKPASSSVSSTQSRFRPLAKPAHCAHIAATDPAHTTQLWKAVMSYRSDTASSRGKRRAIPSASAPATSSSPLSLRSQQPSTSITASSVTASQKKDKEITAKITDTDFEIVILDPYGIKIVHGRGNDDLRQYFNVVGPDISYEDRLHFYREAFPLSIWLDGMDRCLRVEEEYKSMKVYGSNEAEYSAYALRDILLDEPRHPWLPTSQGDQRWLPIRLLQLVRKPGVEYGDGSWKAPSELRKPTKRYGWDIRPDCAYYVSLQAFQTGMRSRIAGYIPVIQDRAFCPYFTIEFKKDADDLKTACNQVAVASTIALYNRYLLKSSALQKSGKPWEESHEIQMRHYGMTFTGAKWKLWCTKPKSLQTWTGCNTSMIYMGYCDILVDVKKLFGIINDIHYWGLEVHGKSCKADIAALVQFEPGTDLDDITLLE
ncbi:hypothetical protein F4777DRAFT_545989 [Nemania sp. FL0916]|nr:hypothetical protein F4777DRAFT_545989 [Nemania sp. FL0916]